MQQGHPNTTESFLDRFRRDLKALLDPGDACLVAVSGGLDSVVLLRLLMQARLELHLSLGVAHLHHGIRGTEADEDQSFVRELASDYALPFFTRKVNSVAFAKEHKLSLEEAARDQRYAFFADMLEGSDFTKLATAHTRNDQAETVLAHFLRGAGSRGLRGMLAKRGPYVRPLLGFGRETLARYAAEQGLAHREDSTNDDMTFRRNRIRKELLPYLEAHFNPNIIRILERTADIFGQTEAFLSDAAEEAYKSLVSLQEKNEIILDIDGYLGYNDLVQKYLLAHCCRRLSLDPGILNFVRLTEIGALIAARVPGKKLILAGDFQIMVDHDGIVLGRPQTTEMPTVKIDLTHGDRLAYENYCLMWSLLAPDESPRFTQDKDTEYLDFDRVGRNVALRGFVRGDKFVPLHFKGTKKVSDFFTDKKIPLRARAHQPIIESPTGIVWICGHQIDDRFKVTPETTRVLKMSMRKLADERRRHA